MSYDYREDIGFFFDKSDIPTEIIRYPCPKCYGFNTQLIIGFVRDKIKCYDCGYPKNEE